MKNAELTYIWSDRKRLLLFGLPWTFTKYKLTDEKMLIETGFFTINFDEVRLYRIMDLSLKQTLLQRLFGLGTISVTSNDKSLGDFEIKNIKNPLMIKEMLSEKVEAERVKKRVSSREYMAADDIETEDDDV